MVYSCSIQSTLFNEKILYNVSIIFTIFPNHYCRVCYLVFSSRFVIIKSLKRRAQMITENPRHLLNKYPGASTIFAKDIYAILGLESCDFLHSIRHN
jgi:hypothetical protein